MSGDFATDRSDMSNFSNGDLLHTEFPVIDFKEFAAENVLDEATTAQSSDNFSGEEISEILVLNNAEFLLQNFAGEEIEIEQNR